MLPEPQPVDCPSERGRNYTPPEGSVLRPAGGFLRKADDCPQRSGSSQSSQGKLHFPCAGCRQLPLCGLAAREHLALQAVPVQQVYNSSIPNSGRLWYNKVNDKLEFCEGEVSMKKIGLGIAILLFAIIISLCSSGMGLLVIGIGIVGLIFSIIGFIENK